jgi:hypothetical protein
MIGLPGASGAEMRYRQQQVSRLLELVEQHVPDPQLLPSLHGSAMKRALTRITTQEKRDLYRVLYGTMEYDEFFDRRRDAKRFQPWDRQVDTAAREIEAHANFERLLRIRDQTKGVRPEIQGLLARIVDGEIPLRHAHDLMQRLVQAFWM